MILIDFSAIAAANIAVQMSRDEMTEDFLRHMVLNALRTIRVQFKADEWGEMIVACDAGNYWRRDIFPYYKANRAKTRDSSGVDWEQIFGYIDNFRDEIKENFPYRVVCVDKCEADDIIATLSIGSSPKEQIVIVSRDADFHQLHILPNVKQFDHINKQFITCNDPIKARVNLIMRGDPGDGVPNVLSQDDCFVRKIRQTALRQDYIDQLWNLRHEERPESIRQRIERNQKMVDLFYLPIEYGEKIVWAYNAEANKPVSKEMVLSYLVSKNLKYLSTRVEEFF